MNEEKRDISLNTSSGKQEAMTVSRVVSRIKTTLEEVIGEVLVKGEISNLGRSGSGHVYFDLKDEDAILPVALFAHHARNVDFDLEDGLEVLIQGQVSAYARRGNYQIRAETVKPLGEGALQLAFEQRKEKLREEGLFEDRHKQPLPELPSRIALITSGRGAAVRDLIHSIHGRFPPVTLRVVPVHVQGDQASGEIVEALRMVNHHDLADVIVTGRGGGSLEDLWAFNEEEVVRAIFESRLPVVSAVGHEVDTTLADLVADRYAPNPNGAGPLVVPEYRQMVQKLRNRADRANRSIQRILQSAKRDLRTCVRTVRRSHPGKQIRRMKEKLNKKARRVHESMDRLLDTCSSQLEAKAAQLESLSPLEVLARGYSITRDAETGSIFTSTDQVEEGDQLETQLAEGRLISTVEKTLDDVEPPESSNNPSL